MQELAQFLEWYPGYGTFEQVLAMPWYRYAQARRIRHPEAFPEAIERLVGTEAEAAVAEVERIIARNQRNHERIAREREERRRQREGG